MSDIVIRVENLGKRYRIGTRRKQTNGLGGYLRNLVTSPFEYLYSTFREPAKAETLWALKDASFEVKQGEVVGIIGRNGAGKSTLLKILSRITEPTEGRARVYGRVGSLLEVGTGFHPELTGRENVYMNGAILGMNQAEIRRKFDEIVAFAGVEKFIDTPVKRYSSGMHVRLGFAVAAHLEPEILLVDEVLAVGDTEFQKKCLGKMGDAAQSGRTVLFVSHNMGAISALCSRSVYLEQGRLVCDANSTETIARYLASVQASAVSNLRHRSDRQGTGRMRFVDTWVENFKGEKIETALSGEDIRIVAEYETTGEHLKTLKVGFALKDPLGQQLSDMGSGIAGFEWPDIPQKGRVSCILKHLPLNAGYYTYNIIGRVNDIIADWIPDAGGFMVETGDFFGSGKLPGKEQGYFLFEMGWELEQVCVE